MLRAQELANKGCCDKKCLQQIKQTGAAIARMKLLHESKDASTILTCEMLGDYVEGDKFKHRYALHRCACAAPTHPCLWHAAAMHYVCTGALEISRNVHILQAEGFFLSESPSRSTRTVHIRRRRTFLLELESFHLTNTMLQVLHHDYLYIHGGIS